MMLWQVEAEAFGKELSTGRTKPRVCNCTGIRYRIVDGSVVSEASNEEFVVKFCGLGEMTPQSRIAELVAALLGQALGVSVIEPAVVAVPADLVPMLPPGHRDAVNATGTRQYGCKYLGSAWYTYAVDKQLEKGLLDLAVSIYVFDMLIQNLDRRVGKPNLLTDGETIKAYDHELAFPFLVPVVGEQSEPWQIQYLQYATEHVFFGPLKGRNIEIDACVESIRRLDDSVLSSIRSAIPDGWGSGELSRIEAHILSVRDNVDKFADEIVRVLK